MLSANKLANDGVVSCNDMSASSTPHRHPRGVALSYIDTRAPLPKSNTAMQCAGWLTPPQSANESRRQSLVYPTASDMPYSAASTTTVFSMPSTPCRSVADQHPAMQSFSQGHLGFDLPASASHAQMAQDWVHLDPDGQTSCDLAPDASWSAHPVMPNGANDLNGHFSSEQADDLWHTNVVPDNSFLHQQSGLQSTLFPVTHAMAANQYAIPEIYNNDHVTTDNHVVDIPMYHDHYHDTMSPYRSPGIVEPALVNPHNDYTEDRYSMLASPGSSSPQDLSASFNSGFSSSFEEIHTPGPDMDRCEDIDGFLHVKDEDGVSPISQPELKPGRSRSSGRRASKRSRKVHPFQQRQNFNGTGIDVHLEGEGISFGGEGLVLTDRTQKKKSFVCIYIEEDGRQCNTAFARSEHLKRHQNKHSKDRKFPCVLPKCNKKIGRSDNACDHFRTHLQTAKRNKRNDHFHWRDVEMRIRDNYPEKQAAKIIVNLERWLKKECAINKELRDAHSDDMWHLDKNFGLSDGAEI